MYRIDPPLLFKYRNDGKALFYISGRMSSIVTLEKGTFLIMKTKILVLFTQIYIYKIYLTYYIYISYSSTIINIIVNSQLYF